MSIAKIVALAKLCGGNATAGSTAGGGGGSGGGSSWRKIKTVTLSQDAGSIEISVDENGNPFELSEFAFAVVGKSLGASGNIGLKINGQLTYYSAKLSNTNTTAELKTAWRGVFAGQWLLIADDAFDAALSHGVVSHVSNVKQKMTSFWYGCTSGAAGVGFQAGTVLELWGC